MARGYNKVILMGNLVRDPEIRMVNEDKTAKFTVAVNEGKYNDKEIVNYIPVVTWKNTADKCEKFLKKGSGVLVEGKIQVRNYDDKDGVRKYITEVKANLVNFTGLKKDEQDTSHFDDKRNGYQKESSANMTSVRDDPGFTEDTMELGEAETAGLPMEEDGDCPF